jgi:hypothetical protein
MKEWDKLKATGIDGRIISMFMLEKQDERACSGLM